MTKEIGRYKTLISQKLNTLFQETICGENMKLLMKSRRRGENGGEMHLKEWSVKLTTGFLWLKIDSIDILLWPEQQTFRFYKLHGVPSFMKAAGRCHMNSEDEHSPDSPLSPSFSNCPPVWWPKPSAQSARR